MQLYFGVVLALFCLVTHGLAADTYKCFKPTISISLLPESDDGKSFVSVTWQLEKGSYEDGDKIVLQSGADEKKEIKVNTIRGLSITDVKFDKSAINVDYEKVETGKLEPEDLGIKVEYQRKDGKVIANSKLSTLPTWMTKEFVYLERTDPTKVFIPGTHESFNIKGAATDKGVLPNQDLTIKQQLLMGVRYLDIDVTKSGEDYYVFIKNEKGEDVNLAKIVDVIKDVKEFCRVSAKEHVILDFNEFGKDFDHAAFIKFLKPLLITEKDGKPDNVFVVPNSPFKITDKKDETDEIIVAYNDKATVEANKDFLWSSKMLPGQEVSEQESVATLQHYFNELFYGDKLKTALGENAGKLYVAMAYLNSGVSPRDNVISHSREISNIFSSYTVSSQTNVVAYDFFTSTDLVQKAIIFNRRKHDMQTKCFCDYDFEGGEEHALFTSLKKQ